jgi:hypothetical protein
MGAEMSDDDSKPFVHKLEAKGFDLTMWEPLETFPRDGRTVSLECSDSIRRTAFWDSSVGGIILDEALPDGVILLHWRER